MNSLTSHITWIVFAEQGRTRVFESSRGQAVRNVRDVVHAEGRLHDSELETDRAGSGFSRVGPGRTSKQKEETSVEHSTRLFVTEIAHYLDKARHLGQYTDLKIVAAPAILGELRKHLSEPTLAMVSTTIDKDLARASTRDLHHFMAEQELLAPPDDDSEGES